MKYQFLFPVASMVMVAPAYATTYLSIEEAQQIMFPGVKLERDFRPLDRDTLREIEQRARATAYADELQLWKAPGQGWFMVDKVVGKHEFITYALGLNEDGSVRDVEILDYRETHGDEIRQADWRAQFTGLSFGDPVKLEDGIRNISGATLSCKHITDGVRRLLTTFHMLVAAG